mmetsp:Transcript_24262/g.56223  ORF Transcript_24262/g.56223 Transcript_24262/m.56223 type:complete len:565 (+) Transcript_24262:67-1761(+)
MPIGEPDIFEVTLTPSFSRAGKTASNTAGIKNIVKMAQASARYEQTRRQQEMTSLHSVHRAVQYKALTEAEPVLKNYSLDRGREQAICSSPRVAEHWQLQPQDEDEEEAQTAFQRIVQWHAADDFQEESPRSERDTKEEATKTREETVVRPSPAFMNVPRGRSHLDLKHPDPPPVGHYQPRHSTVDRRLPTFSFKSPVTVPRPSTGGGTASLRAARKKQEDEDQGATGDWGEGEDAEAAIVRPSTAPEPRAESPSYFFRTTKQYHGKLLRTQKEVTDQFYDPQVVRPRIPVARLDRPDRKIVGVDQAASNKLNNNRWYPEALEKKDKLMNHMVQAVPFSKLTGRDVKKAEKSEKPEDSLRIDYREQLEVLSPPKKPTGLIDFSVTLGRDAVVSNKLNPNVEFNIPKIPYKISEKLVRSRAKVSLPFNKMLARPASVGDGKLDVEYNYGKAKDRTLPNAPQPPVFNRMTGHKIEDKTPLGTQLMYNPDSPIRYKRVSTPDFSRQSARSSFHKARPSVAIKRRANRDAIDALGVARPSTAPPGAQPKFMSASLNTMSSTRPKSRGA